MTIAAVGSSLVWDSGNPSWTPVGVGNYVIATFITKFATSPTVSNVSSPNATWTELVSPQIGSNSTFSGSVWIGKVTSTSPGTVTVTWSGGSQPSFWQADVREFSTSVGTLVLDVFGKIDTTSANTADVSLTPAGAGELYYSFHYDDTGAVAGSTSGYTYVVDSHGNGVAYNVNCSSSTQSPTWGGGFVKFAVGVLVKEQSSAVTGTGAVTLKKMTVAGSGSVKVAGSGSVTLKKMTVAASGNVIDSGSASTSLKKMTVAASGNIKVPGTADITLKKMITAASGNVIDSGAIDVTLKKMTVSGSGNVKVPGTADVNLKKMTVFGTGALPISGNIVVVMRKMTVAGAGNIKIPGTVSVTMRKMQVYASDGHASGASSLFIFSQL